MFLFYHQPLLQKLEIVQKHYQVKCRKRLKWQTNEQTAELPVLSELGQHITLITFVQKSKNLNCCIKGAVKAGDRQREPGGDSFCENSTLCTCFEDICVRASHCLDYSLST